MSTTEHRILILEDVASDAELVENYLKKGGLSFVLKRVETREDFSRELDSFAPDIILSDYNLPQFDGLAALEIAKVKCPNVPFIFVSGVMGDELAVQTLKNGAVDYVLKDRLIQLVPAIERALRDAESKEVLKTKVSELEILVKSMVGRELKMVELKKTIADLKEHLVGPLNPTL